MRFIIAIFAFLVLSGCATPYSGSGVFGGAGVKKIDDNHYEIITRVNGFTDRERFRNIVLMKAAETTAEAGRTHFTIVSEQDKTTVTLVNFVRITKIGSDVRIKVFSVARGAKVPPGSYRAEEVIRDIGPKLQN